MSLPIQGNRVHAIKYSLNNSNQFYPSKTYQTDQHSNLSYYSELLLSKIKIQGIVLEFLPQNFSQ